MACRGCESGSGCGCSVVGTDPITVSGVGSGAVPFTVGFDSQVWLEGLTHNDADPTTLNAPRIPAVSATGAVYSVPLPLISDVSAAIRMPAASFAFTFSNSTTNADPGDGFIRLNNATPASATAIYVDLQDTNGTVITTWLDAIAVGSRIRLYRLSAPVNYAEYAVTSVTTVTGYRNIAVTYVSGNGTFDGTTGNTGLSYTAGGATGATGAAGSFASAQTLLAVTGAYTLVLTDAGKYLRGSNASAFSITVPLNATVAFATGTHIDFIQSGAGQITFAATGGVTINATPGLKLTGQWAGATLVKVGTDEWDLVGNLTS